MVSEPVQGGGGSRRRVLNGVIVSGAGVRGTHGQHG